jgi:hypothetical protein
MTHTQFIDGKTLLEEWEHIEDTERVLGRLFAHPISVNAEPYDRFTDAPIEVPWELANAVD